MRTICLFLRPALRQEVKNICLAIGIPDINLHCVRKTDIQKAINKSHYQNMMGRFEGSSKLEDIKKDNFRVHQEYFNDKNCPYEIQNLYQNARKKPW